MKVRGILFDLDGTLLDTLNDLADAANYALTAKGYPMRSRDEVRQFVGNGVRLLIKRALPADVSDVIVDETLAIFKDYYASHSAVKTAPYPGILQLLEEASACGITCSVVSNKFDLAVKELCTFYFGDRISTAVGENEAAGIRKKPAPDAVFLALEQSGLTPGDCVYVGDSDVDVATARNAGMICIGCAWGFRGREFLLSHGADHVIDAPGELLPLLEKL